MTFLYHAISDKYAEWFGPSLAEQIQMCRRIIGTQVRGLQRERSDVQTKKNNSEALLRLAVKQNNMEFKKTGKITNVQKAKTHLKEISRYERNLKAIDTQIQSLETLSQELGSVKTSLALSTSMKKSGITLATLSRRMNNEALNGDMQKFMKGMMSMDEAKSKLETTIEMINDSTGNNDDEGDEEEVTDRIMSDLSLNLIVPPEPEPTQNSKQPKRTVTDEDVTAMLANASFATPLEHKRQIAAGTVKQTAGSAFTAPRSNHTNTNARSKTQKQTRPQSHSTSSFHQSNEEKEPIDQEPSDEEVNRIDHELERRLRNLQRGGTGTGTGTGMGRGTSGQRPTEQSDPTNTSEMFNSDDNT